MSSQNDKGAVAIYENFVRDLRYAIRTMRRDYGFAIFAILIVGLGVGASCTVFSVVNTLLIRPLPFRDPGKLVWMANHKDDTNDMSGKTVQVNYLLDYKEKNQSFEDMAAYFAFYGAGDWKLIGDGQPERLTSVPVTQNFFPLLGVKPQLGRSFTVEECKWRGPRVMMITDSLWRRKFAADPNIVGKALPFEGGAMTVVGVLPASFDFGTIFTPGSSVDVYEPFPLSPETNRWGNTIAIIGRLKPGASVGTAQAEATILGKQLEQLHRDMNDFVPKLSMLSEHVSGRVRPAVQLMRNHSASRTSSTSFRAANARRSTRLTRRGIRASFTTKVIIPRRVFRRRRSYKLDSKRSQRSLHRTGKQIVCSTSAAGRAICFSPHARMVGPDTALMFLKTQ